MGKFFDTISGNKGRRKAIQRAAAEQQFAPFRLDSAFGDVQIGPEGATVTGGAGAGLIDPFTQFAQGALALPGLNLDPNAVVAGGFNAAQNPLAAAFTGAGTDVLQAFRGFDPDAFAQTQFERLNRLAAPGEETQTQAVTNRLFGAGRLGREDTTSGQVFRDLDLSQRLARDQRLLSAIGLAGQEQERLAGLATGFAGAGNQFSTDAVNRFLAAIGGGTGVGGFNLQQAVGATGGINAALAPQLDAFKSALSGSALATEVNLARGGTLAGFDPSKGASSIGSAVGGLIGGFLG